MSVQKSVSPSSLVEPGGDYAVNIVINNLSTVEDIELTALVDEPGTIDLDGDGDCSLPQTIAPGASYSCSLDRSLAGNAGDSESDTVTATASDNEDNEISASDGATFSISDLLPSIDVTKTADPATLPEPGGDVTFTVRVDNLANEAATITELDDDVYGDVTVVSGDMVSTDCSVPQPLSIGGSYTCSFVATVINNSGETVLDFVTATAVDDEGNSAEDTDSASVLISDEVPVFTVQKSAIPTSVPEPGGPVFFTIRIDNTGQERDHHHRPGRQPRRDRPERSRRMLCAADDPARRSLHLLIPRDRERQRQRDRDRYGHRYRRG